MSVGSTALEPSPALDHISGGSNPTFTVKVEDSGSNPETGVKVEVSVTAGGKQYKASHVINKTEPGATANVDIPVEAFRRARQRASRSTYSPSPGRRTTKTTGHLPGGLWPLADGSGKA